MSSKETQDLETEDAQETEGGEGGDEKKSEKDDQKEASKKTPSLEDELREKIEEAARLREQFLRLQAETDNFKKRITREKNDFAQFANERLLKELIPIHENLARAFAAPNPNLQSLKEGLDMISKQFSTFLEKEKVKPIPSVGEKFDPAVHEALSQAESEEHEENTVIQEFSKGFFLNDRVLIPAKVVISKKPVKSQHPETPESAKKDKSETASKKTDRSEKSKKKHKRVAGSS